MRYHSDRDTRLDILRGIGLLCIILAHVGPPGFIFQLRNFDVPLMVMVSGAAYPMSNSKNEKYRRYLLNRFIRLVVPTWIFLSVFFVAAFFASWLLRRSYPFSINSLLSSFALMNGIGYVWVIRVFLLVAMIMPFASKTISGKRSPLQWTALGIVYCIYEVTVRYTVWSNNHMLNEVVNEFVFYVVPFGVVVTIGMMMQQIIVKRRLVMASIFLFAFCCIAVYLCITTGEFVPTQIHKYPPTIYYLSFAIGVSLLLYSLIELSQVGYTYIGRILAWIGKRTMWTYLWHISILYLLNWIHFKSNFILMFLIVFGTAISITIIQDITLKRILPMFGTDEIRRRITMVFSG